MENDNEGLKAKAEFVEMLLTLGDELSGHPETGPDPELYGMNEDTVKALTEAVEKALSELWLCWCGEPALFQHKWHKALCIECYQVVASSILAK